MNVTVSIGGSVLAPDLDSDRVAAHAETIERLRAAGHDVSVVVGGGATAREYIGAARDLGENEMGLDAIGIAATRLNARLLIAALGETAAPTPVETYEEAGATLQRDVVPVMGGVQPGQTTDAVSAALAEYTDADLLVLATSVPGVYDADPNEDDDAERFETMTAADLVDLIVDERIDAGSSVPVDLLAAKLIQRAEFRTLVLDGTDPDAVARAVLDDDYEGTEIVAES
jgi:uridylate kinase